MSGLGEDVLVEQSEEFLLEQQGERSVAAQFAADGVEGGGAGEAGGAGMGGGEMPP